MPSLSPLIGIVDDWRLGFGEAHGQGREGWGSHLGDEVRLSHKVALKRREALRHHRVEAPHELRLGHAAIFVVVVVDEEALGNEARAAHLIGDRSKALVQCRQVPFLEIRVVKAILVPVVTVEAQGHEGGGVGFQVLDVEHCVHFVAEGLVMHPVWLVCHAVVRRELINFLERQLQPRDVHGTGELHGRAFLDVVLVEVPEELFEPDPTLLALPLELSQSSQDPSKKGRQRQARVSRGAHSWLLGHCGALSMRMRIFPLPRRTAFAAGLGALAGKRTTSSSMRRQVQPTLGGRCMPISRLPLRTLTSAMMRPTGILYFHANSRSTTVPYYSAEVRAASSGSRWSRGMK